MLKTFLKSSAAVAVALVAIAPASATVLIANTGWHSDSVSVAGQASSNSPWTFTVDAASILSVTDDFVVGDIYTLSGDITGSTTFYAGNVGDVQANGSFAAAWLSGRFSKIAVLVGPGSYSFSIAGDCAGGCPAGFGVRLDTAPAVPEPMTWALMATGLGAVGFSMRRRKVNTAVSFV
ncbi:MAG: PEP-CTERM sorting domain-containing protein [Sphingobium sp.]|nr:PEP-CTERM sorting domain-containing protein [Sphingobium sp.]